MQRESVLGRSYNYYRENGRKRMKKKKGFKTAAQMVLIFICLIYSMPVSAKEAVTEVESDGKFHAVTEGVIETEINNETELIGETESEEITELNNVTEVNDQSEENTESVDQTWKEEKRENTNKSTTDADNHKDEFEFLSITQSDKRISTLKRFEGVITWRDERENWWQEQPCKITIKVGKDTYTKDINLRMYSSGEYSQDFYINFPDQLDGTILEIQISDEEGRSIREVFTLKNVPKKIDNLRSKDIYNTYYCDVTDDLEHDIFIDITLYIGGDQYKGENTRYITNQKHGYSFKLNKKYKSGTKYQIKFIGEQSGYYSSVSGTVEAYGEVLNCTMNELDDTSTEVTGSITNYLKDDISKDGEELYIITLKIGNEKVTYYTSTLKHGEKTNFKLQTKYLYKAGTAYQLEFEGLYSRVVKTISRKIKHNPKLDGCYRIKAGPLYDDQTSFRFSISDGSYSDTYISEYVLVTVTIGGKQYTYKFDSDDIYEYSMFYDGQKTIKLPKNYKKNQSYTISIQGISTGAKALITKKVVHSKKAPSLKADKITYQDNYITGKTLKNSKVQVKIGKKTYKGKANSHGKYRIKIKQQKIGTKCKVTAISSLNGNKKTVTAKIKNASVILRGINTIYKDSRSIDGEIQGAAKGDYVVAIIEGRTYKGKINTKTNRYSIPMAANNPGTAQIVVYNKFKQRLTSQTETIYLSDTIYVGMHVSQVVQTTFGRPNYINRYLSGALEQWVYRKGSYTLYLYVQNGVVTSFDKIYI